MSKDQNGKINQPVEGLSSEKTNEDFNKQKPDLNDPNQTKNSTVGKEVAKEKRKRNTDSMSS